jgi:gas vesicle protein
MQSPLYRYNGRRKKKFFRCNKVKYRGKQCGASIYLLFESISDQFVLYRDESDHTRDTIHEQSSRISNEVKETINEL